MSLYSNEIMKHFKNPQNVGRIKKCDALGKVGNLSCGDIMYLYLKIGKNKKGEEIIKDTKFETFGCTVAIANTSLLTTMIKGKTLNEAMKITKDDLVKKFGNIPLIKVHCSLLAVDALAEAIYDYYKKNKKPISQLLQEKHEKAERIGKEMEHRHSAIVELEEELHKK
ncbi:MAG: NifU protein [Parcubacteria group bacterium Licking1014_1]|nr:MAG: NifU protein [Parcubacteria group bacterium Licking1014_1]